MKKEVIVLLLLGILLVSPLILAQEQAQTYSGFSRFVDNVKMFFSFGDNKVMLALEIREEEVDSAIINSQDQNEKDAIKNLERAHKRLQFINGKVSLDVVDEVKESVDEIVNKIEDEEDLSDNFDVYVLEEKKTKLTGELIENTYEYCKELAEEDFALMLEEEDCNPETAPEPIKEDLEKLRDLQLKMFVQLMLEIRSCIDDPGTCNCEANVEVEQKAKCEKMVALAIKCEYKEDETSCNELKAMEPKKGDSFAESFVPEFLRNLFREKSYMVEYDIEPSCGVPEECWDENDKPECKQYEHLKETNDDWDEYGNFIGTKKGCGTKDQAPTMRESIPQCFDENDNFLEEKCGEITMVENEDGLINYLIGKEIDNIINEFENASEHTIDVGGERIDEGEWTIDGEQMQVENKVREIKEEIKDINGEIANWVVDHPVEDGESDGGLTWEIKTEVAGDGEGTGGLTPEIETDVASGGHDDDNDVVTDGGNEGMAPGTSGTSTNDVIVSDEEEEYAQGGYAPGTTAEESN